MHADLRVRKIVAVLVSVNVTGIIYMMILVPVGALGSFIRRPQNITVYYGEKANFTCSISLDQHSQIFWYITEDYILPGSLPEVYGVTVVLERIGNERIDSTLSLDASSETNNTLVECKGDSRTNPDIFSDAVLSVQGKVERVSSLSFSVRKNYILLVWEAPYTLLGTHLQFKIRVNVSAPGADISRSLVTPHTNHTFSYSELNINRCDLDHNIEFSVAGVNPAGEGGVAFANVTVPQDTDQCGEQEQDVGRLGPPSMLSPTLYVENVSLIWTPPFTLTNIHYYIVVIMDEQTFVVVTFNTTDSFITIQFSALNIDPCNHSYVYTVTVRGVNSVGEGELSTIVLEIPQDMKYCPPTTTQRTTAEESTSINPEQDLIKHVSIFIPVVVMVVLALVVVLCAAIYTCWLLNKRKRKKAKGDSDLPMEPNGGYVVAAVKSNPAYETTHFYEQIDLAVPAPLYEVIAVNVPSEATSPVRSYENFKNAQNRLSSS